MILIVKIPVLIRIFATIAYMSAFFIFKKAIEILEVMQRIFTLIFLLTPNCSFILEFGDL